MDFPLHPPVRDSPGRYGGGSGGPPRPRPAATTTPVMTRKPRWAGYRRVLCPVVFLGGAGEATDGGSFRPSACGLPTTPSRARLKTKKPPRWPLLSAHRRGFTDRGSGRSRTDDGGFAIRCLSHLATEPRCQFLSSTLRKPGWNGQVLPVAQTWPDTPRFTNPPAMPSNRPRRARSFNPFRFPGLKRGLWFGRSAADIVCGTASSPHFRPPPFHEMAAPAGAFAG